MRASSLSHRAPERRALLLSPSHRAQLLKRMLPISAVLILPMLVAVALPRAMEIVRVLGRNIPSSDPEADYVFGVLWAFVLTIVVYALPFHSRMKADVLAAWSVKVAVVLLLLPIYEYANPVMDAYSYYSVPREQSFVKWDWDIRTGTTNVVNAIWYHQQVLPDSFHLTMVSAAFIGFVATLLLYRAAVCLMGHDDRRVFFLLTLFPSFLFWSSLLGKDPLTLLGLSLYVYGVVAGYTTGAKRPLLLAILGVVLTTFIRSWFASMMIISLLPFILFKRPSHLGSGRRRGVPGCIQILLVPLMVGGAVYALFQSTYGQVFQSTDAVTSSATSISGSFARGESGNELGGFTSIGDLVLYLPLGVVTALFRPLPGEVLNIAGLLSSVENLVMLLFAFKALQRFQVRLLFDPLFAWAFSFTLLWSAQYGATAAGNLGSLVRYRLQVLPFLVGLILYTLYTDRRAPAPQG